MSQKKHKSDLLSLLDGRLFALVDERDEEALARQLRRSGFQVSFIDGKDISNGETALHHIAIALGCSDNHASWYDLTDAFSDMRHGSEVPIALLWRNVTATIDCCLLDFLGAMEELLNMVEPPLILDEEHRADNEHEFASFGLILMAKGSGFRRIALGTDIVLQPGHSMEIGDRGIGNES